MKKERFEELVSNVKEAVAIHKGEKRPKKIYRYDPLDVRAIRATFGFSQAKFAAMLGISSRTLEGWEQGRRQPTGPARRLLEVAASFPAGVYQAIFGRAITTERNGDATTTTVETPISHPSFAGVSLPQVDPDTRHTIGNGAAASTETAAAPKPRRRRAV